MKYQYGKRRRAGEYEKALIEYWKKNKTFEKSIEQRDIDNSYVFYDGPPFITGNPHHGTLLSSVVKDAVEGITRNQRKIIVSLAAGQFPNFIKNPRRGNYRRAAVKLKAIDLVDIGAPTKFVALFKELNLIATRGQPGRCA